MPDPSPAAQPAYMNQLFSRFGNSLTQTQKREIPILMSDPTLYGRERQYHNRPNPITTMPDTAVGTSQASSTVKMDEDIAKGEAVTKCQ
ncbi:hypothetical protein BZG36_01590 [Bifiguratus adelaidae]|uniref:Uncharacterized protein n=1 Tax=Bifiguratus adelaidae TaxID=1938954 RepID=A0A261Y3Z0_9FUNG|nr:hypothetical protein BZG36_01590 [Bifiguratus adelaidae]